MKEDQNPDETEDVELEDEVEAELDRVLNELDKKYAASDEDEDEDEDEEAAEEGAEDESAEEDAEDESAEEEEEEEDDSEGEIDPNKLAAAKRTLARAKAPKHVLDKMTPGELIEWAAEVGKIQSDYDATYSRNKELEGQIEKGSHKGQPSDNDGQPPAGVDNPDLDLIRAELGDEVADRLQATMQNSTKPLAEQNAAMVDTLERLIVKETVGELRDEFPQLAEEAKIDEMVKKATKLIAAPGAYEKDDLVENLKDAMRDAANLLWLKENQSRQSEQRKKVRDARRRGTSSKPKNSNARPKPKTVGDKEDMALNMIEAGASREEVRRALGTL